MRIAQIAPLHESVPPKTYGGIERIVDYLVHELVEMGHEVTLYASGDSVTPARLRPGCDVSLRAAGWEHEPTALHLLLVECAMAEASEHDFLHFHLDAVHFPFLRRQPVAHLTTLHNGLEHPGIPQLLHEYRELPLVSISNAEREPVPDANYAGTVYNGIPRDLLRFESGKGRYLAFLGRFSPEKGACRAIEIARRVGMPIKLAGKHDPRYSDYYEAEVKPRLAESFVEYVGEINDREKQEFLGNATALLFPIEWREPFGLVMIESMACGTPVVAYPNGAVPEVIDDGVTGYVVRNLDAAAEAVRKVEALSRLACRERFELRFTAERMARDYVRVYEQLRFQLSLAS